ncbi:LysR family transcriptional regulator [Paralcaligenes sp. KSB-10]|uniref:LysR family transcriptional regulator n=1 Tax=Paralcaligenes sp. KSB-10 TaxID=2901142 RepID=UPI001E56BAFA|nr:LysR family transcriptional regulator [Paralcaligenes sp. KSB-10]UHL64539.1 LysR family transcriptional regulator [Paralcaligenes sp. KSB-10]
MRLEDLNYFLAVAEAGHVGRASERLGQSQPALTKGVQRLEKELQLQLFERTPKGMVLTTVGQAFFQRARGVQFGLSEAIKEANDLHLGKLGLLRVGVPPNYTSYFGDACAILLQQRPAARVHVTIGLNDKLFAALRLGDLDLSISAILNQPQTELEQHALFTDNLHVVAREGHPLFFSRNLRFSDLAKESWILPGQSVVARRSIDARFEEHGLPAPNVAVESSSSSIFLIGMVRATDLLTVSSASAMKQAGSHGLRAFPLREAVWPRTVGITTRRGAYLSPLALRFMELLKQHPHPGMAAQ